MPPVTPLALSLAALAAFAPVASGQNQFAAVSPAIQTVAEAPRATAAVGLYATDGGMVEVRDARGGIEILAHGAEIAATLAPLAASDAVLDARTETLLDAWTLDDLGPLVAATRPDRRDQAAASFAAYRAALVRGRGDAVAGRVIGTFDQTDGRAVTLVQMLFARGAEWASFVWDEDGHLVTVTRGLSPVVVGTARPTGADAYVANGQPLVFEREADGRVHALHVGNHLSAVR